MYTQDQCPKLRPIGLDAQEDGFRSRNRERLPPHIPLADVDSDIVGIPRCTIYAIHAIQASTTEVQFIN